MQKAWQVEKNNSKYELLKSDIRILQIGIGETSGNFKDFN